ncbi:MAG: hypothetical protein V3V02_10755 [Rhizobiaceae bacterium]
MTKIDDEIEIACTLNDEEFRERRALARQTIIPKILKYRRVKNGLSLAFANAPDTRSDVKEFIRLEKGCCGFLTFELSPVSHTSDEAIIVVITGPPDATKFIDIFIGLVEGDADDQNAA